MSKRKPLIPKWLTSFERTLTACKALQLEPSVDTIVDMLQTCDCPCTPSDALRDRVTDYLWGNVSKPVLRFNLILVVRDAAGDMPSVEEAVRMLRACGLRHARDTDEHLSTIAREWMEHKQHLSLPMGPKP